MTDQVTGTDSYPPGYAGCRCGSCDESIAALSDALTRCTLPGTVANARQLLMQHLLPCQIEDLERTRCFNVRAKFTWRPLESEGAGRAVDGRITEQPGPMLERLLTRFPQAMRRGPLRPGGRLYRITTLSNTFPNVVDANGWGRSGWPTRGANRDGYLCALGLLLTLQSNPDAFEKAACCDGGGYTARTLGLPSNYGGLI